MAMMFIIVALALVFMACSGTTGVDFVPVGIDVKAIMGIAIPVPGEEPLKAIPEMPTFTGTISWVPDDEFFIPGVEYTATITLVSKTGFTFSKVPANHFEIDGAAEVSNLAGSGVIIVKFLPVTYIIIEQQPRDEMFVTFGSISGDLSLEASALEKLDEFDEPEVLNLEYQWFSASNILRAGAVELVGEMNRVFTIPTDLNAGTYYYFCEVSAEGSTSVKSDVATIYVEKADGAPVGIPAAYAVTFARIEFNAVVAPSNGQTVEYSISENDDETELSKWQSSIRFEGLTPETTYYIYARSAENGNYNAGEASISDAIATKGFGDGEVRICSYWADQHDALAVTNNGIFTVSPGTIVRISAVNTEAAEVFRWYLNGEVVKVGGADYTGTEYSFSSEISGKHVVGLVVEIDGEFYDTNITITVVRN